MSDEIPVPRKKLTETANTLVRFADVVRLTTQQAHVADARALALELHKLAEFSARYKGSVQVNRKAIPPPWPRRSWKPEQRQESFQAIFEEMLQSFLEDEKDDQENCQFFLTLTKVAR